MHPRKQIRHAVRDLLKDATAAEGRVSATRVTPHRLTNLPAISVYTLGEDVDENASLATAPRDLERDLSLTIEAWVAHTAAVPADDAMDDIAEEIEKVMHADPFFKAQLGELVSESILSGTDLEVVEDGDRLMGLAILSYAFKYHTLAPAAPAGLDDFRTVGAKFPLALDENGEPDPDVPLPEDVFTVQEPPP